MASRVATRPPVLMRWAAARGATFAIVSHLLPYEKEHIGSLAYESNTDEAIAFFEPWRDQARVIGQAVFKNDEMTGLITGVDDKFKAAATNNPQFSGRKALLLSG